MYFTKACISFIKAHQRSPEQHSKLVCMTAYLPRPTPRRVDWQYRRAGRGPVEIGRQWQWLSRLLMMRQTQGKPVRKLLLWKPALYSLPFKGLQGHSQALNWQWKPWQMTLIVNTVSRSNGGFQTSLGHLRGLGQSSPTRKISIKRKFYDMAFILKVLVNLLKTCFPIYLQDWFLDP